MNRAISCALLALLLAVAPCASGQTRVTAGDIEGTVTDQSGAVVPGATITIINVATNLSRTLVSDGHGAYRVPALPPGVYTVRVELSGFEPAARSDVTVLLGQTVTVDVRLLLAGTTEQVTVLAQPPLVQVGHTEVSSVVNQRLIEDLPINGRNFISFSVITPGVSTDRTPQQGASATSGLTFAGQRARSNNIMVDGLDNNDGVTGAVRATFSQEAIREFQVLTDSYSAEFGKASGGVVNIVTKSGTNDLHGNAFMYFRDKRLNAKNYFDKYDIFGTPIDLEKAPFTQTQWGATAGGPLRTDKTFYFLSVERTDIGDSRLVTISPATAAILTAGGFPVETGNVPLDVRNTELFARGDHQWSAAHQFVVRGNYADATREGIDDYGGTVARSRGTVQLRKDWALSAAHTDLFTDRWLNEFRSQVAYEDQTIQSLDPACGGPCDGVDQGGPTLEITGAASVGRQRFTPQPRTNVRLQLLDTVSYVGGRHHGKVGVEYNWINNYAGGLPLHFGGRYIFSAIPQLGLASGLDAFQRGIPAAYVQGYGNPEHPYVAGDISAFAQDEWKLGRLVVKPGLRYQRQLWPSVNYSVSDVGGGTFQYSLPNDNNNLAPRVAVAYDLTGDGRTSVHGSYGIFYENVITSIVSITQIVNGASDGVRTLVLPAPLSVAAWNAPGHRLTEAQAAARLGGFYPSTVITLDPSLKTGFTHQSSIGVNHSFASDFALNVNALYVRGFNQPGTIDYNPVLPGTLGANRRPNDLPCAANPAAACLNGGIPGSSASILQYTSFAESWYKGLTVALTKRLSGRHQFLASYTLSKAEDTATDYQSNFIVQNNGFGRNPDDKYGLPLGFDANLERGPSTQDQRHRFVLSGIYEAPADLNLSAIFTAASGRPFTPLAGADLNGDGNGGAFPPDRARTNPADPSTAVARNSERTAAQYNVDLRVSRVFRIGRTAAVEAILDAFNVFNRTNFIEDTNQSSFVIFGAGAYPSNPLPTYGKYTLALPPRQVQLALKLSF
jgi:hypothetical protein